MSLLVFWLVISENWLTIKPFIWLTGIEQENQYYGKPKSTKTSFLVFWLNGLPYAQKP